MFNVQSIAYVAFGVIACFSGYSMFRTLLPLWGFLIIGWIALSVVPMFIQLPGTQSYIVRIAAFVVGGVIGAVIATPLYHVMIFISGAALGALMGNIIGALIALGGLDSMTKLDAFTSMSFPPQTTSPVQFVIMVILGAILGAVALSFQKFMVTASSAFIGAAALVGALSGVIVGGLVTDSPGVVVIMAWFFVGFIGLFVQYRFAEDEV